MVVLHQVSRVSRVFAVEDSRRESHPEVLGLRSTQKAAEDLKAELSEAGVAAYGIRIREINLGLLDEDPVLVWRATVSPAVDWDTNTVQEGLDVSLSRAVSYRGELIDEFAYFSPDWSSVYEGGGAVSFLVNNHEEQAALHAAIGAWEGQFRYEYGLRLRQLRSQRRREERENAEEPTAVNGTFQTVEPTDAERAWAGEDVQKSTETE